MSKDKKFYIEVLKSESCQCENDKKRGMAFCYSCFKKLPGYMQKDLYSPIGGGFESAYEEAVNYLN